MSAAAIRVFGFLGCSHAAALYTIWAIADHGINIWIEATLAVIFLGAMVVFPFCLRGKS
jgi:hypothetical protein